MPKNQVKARRLERKLTQKQLAELAGTTQRQIQKVEAGVQTVRFDLAVSVSKALDSSLDQLFPAAKKSLAALRNKKKGDVDLLEEKVAASFAEAGIELDPRIWTIKYLLRNGLMGFHQVAGSEKNRLWRAVQEGGTDSTPFVVFDTEWNRVAINRSHLLFVQFLFDPPYVAKEKRRSQTVVIHMSNNLEPIELNVEPDIHEIGEDDGSEGGAQLQDLFFGLESDCDAEEVVCLTDEDGETAFFRAADIAMLSVPLWAVEPALFRSEMDAIDEGGPDEDANADFEER